MPDRKTIVVSPESEIGRILEEAETEPIYLSKEGLIFRIVAEDREPDSELVERAIDTFAGSWADIDAGKAISAIYRAREEGSRAVSRFE